MPRVIVAGAGIGGLALAQGLRRAGIDVTVYERDGADGRPQGISLHMDERGRSALQACLPPEQAALAEATMGGPREQALQLGEVGGELAVVGSLNLDGEAAGARRGRQASRPLLRAVLRAGIEDAVRFGAEVTRFEQQGDGTVRVWLADGSSDSADLLVGADGIGSAVRRQYLPQAQVLDTGKRMLMGATPLRAIAATGLLELIGDSPSNFQEDGTMRMAMGALRFAEAPAAARDRWLPTLSSAAIDGAEEYAMWALPASADAVPAGGAPADVWRLAGQLTAGLPPALRRLVDGAWPEVTVPLRIGMIPPPPAWSPSAVTLIGDAIHIAPGFGGNLALQDAHRLSDALAGFARGERDLLSAVGSYEEAMRRDSFITPGKPPAAAASNRPNGGEK